ncbi:MAG TPA: asparagine synthase C-terminal domain-containing protein [Ktedonobacterales bacterium]
MFLSAYLGDEVGAEAWRAIVVRHAGWLGLPITFRNGLLRTGKLFSIAWIAPRGVNPADGLEETARYVALNARGMVFPPDRSASSPSAPPESDALLQQRLVQQGTMVTLGVTLDTCQLLVNAPATTPEQCYISEVRNALVIANDLRLMLQWAGLEIDERGVCSLLQYGALVPPLTLSRHVRRVPNGFTLRVESETGRQTLHCVGQDVFRPATEAARTARNPDAAVLETLDGILHEAPRGSLLYFSGGVDSALLASRLSVIGRTDIQLVNYAFGPDDAESEQAQRMARALQLPCERIMYDSRELSGVLERLGRDYSYPFADYSIIPTNLLMHASLAGRETRPGAVEGTGADGAFGLGAMYETWRRFYRVPDALRGAISGAYARFGLWRDDGRLGRAGRIARRSHLPLHVAAVIAQNSLEGIAYRIPPKIRQEMLDDVETYEYALSEGLEADERMSVLDLVHVCAGEMAAKSFDLFRWHGTQPIYPFLDPRMVRLSASLTWEQKCPGGETKGLLKRALAQRVPHDLVYRRKSGFIPPFETMLTTPSMQAFLHDIVLSPANPVMGTLRPDIVRRMIERGGQGRPLNLETYFFLWGVTFLSGWLYQVQAQRQSQALG